MILFYSDGKVNRVRVDFSDIPFPFLPELNSISSMEDVKDNQDKLLFAYLILLESFKNKYSEMKFSVLTYQNRVLWLTIED